MSMTIDEAARYLGFHPESLRRLVRGGVLPAVKAGRQWRLDKTALENRLRVNRCAPSRGYPGGSVSSIRHPHLH